MLTKDCIYFKTNIIHKQFFNIINNVYYKLLYTKQFVIISNICFNFFSRFKFFDLLVYFTMLTAPDPNLKLTIGKPIVAV